MTRLWKIAIFTILSLVLLQLAAPMVFARPWERDSRYRQVHRYVEFLKRPEFAHKKRSKIINACLGQFEERAELFQFGFVQVVRGYTIDLGCHCHPRVTADAK